MKKLGIVILTLVLLAMSVCVFAQEDENKILSYAIGGYTGDETALFSPDNSEARGVERFEMSERSLSVSGDVDEVRRRRANNIIMACAYTPHGSVTSGGLTMSLDLTEKRIELNDYAVMSFGVGVICGFQNNDAYSIHVELITSDSVFVSDYTIENADMPMGWYMTYLDLSEVYGYAEMLNITFHFDSDTKPEQVRISTPFVRVRGPSAFDIADLYSAGSLSAIEGKLGDELGNVIPSERGSAAVRGRIVTSDRLTVGSTAYFRIEIDGVRRGQLTFALEYTDSTKHKEFISSPINVDGETVFTVPVKIEGDVLSYILKFDRVDCEESFYINSVKIYGDGAADIATYSGLGSLDSLERVGNSIKFDGKLARDVVKAYSDASIGFFALPGNSRGDISTAVELGRIKVSTKFGYTADLTPHRISADTHAFMAAIVADDNIIPISSPRYFDAYDIARESLSPVGLCGAAPAGAFESNISHIIVDVPLDKLFEGEKNSAYSIAYSVYDASDKQIGSKSINLSSFTVEELDRDVNFYISVGVKVYLRIVAESEIEGLTYGGEAESYAVCLDNASARSLYSETVRFLASRYSSIAGFVIGNGVNDLKNIGDCTDKTIREYAFELAELCRVTYNAASDSHSGVTVLVPFDEKRNEEDYLPIRVLGTMMADQIEESGVMPWTLLYSVDSEGDDVGVPQKLLYTFGDLGIAKPQSVMFYYEPNMKDIVNAYLEEAYKAEHAVDYELAYTEYAVHSFTRLISLCDYADVVFMSLGEITLKNDRNFYSILKDSSELGGFIYESTASAKNSGDYCGSYTVWDFSDKHYSQGWIGGGGIASCLTGYSNADGEKYTRVLKTQLVSDGYGGAGVTLCNSPKTLDLSGVDELKFTFAITREDGELPSSSVSVVFVLGSNDYRAEYVAESVEYGKMQSLNCDLSEYESRDKIDYIGVMIYADEDINFELLSADAYSFSLSDSELAKAFSGADKEETEPISYAAVATVIVLAASLTFVVIILLVRRDREDRETLEREMAESKAKRKAYERQYK